MKPQNKRFDWVQVSQKLQQLHASAGPVLQAIERMEAIYRERAARLALQRVLPDAAATFAALVFTLGTEHYAIELRDLAEVLPFRACTPVPRMAPELAGVLNLRGAIRPVLDVARVMGLPIAKDRNPGWLLVLRRGSLEIGLLVDQVVNVRPFRSGDTVDPAPGGTHSATSYLKGITTDNVMLISTDKLLSLSFIKEGSL
jgi:purine-binding chemotaxis protein CheW